MGYDVNSEVESNTELSAELLSYFLPSMLLRIYLLHVALTDPLRLGVGVCICMCIYSVCMYLLVANDMSLYIDCKNPQA